MTERTRIRVVLEADGDLIGGGIENFTVWWKQRRNSSDDLAIAQTNIACRCFQAVVVAAARRAPAK